MEADTDPASDSCLHIARTAGGRAANASDSASSVIFFASATISEYPAATVKLDVLGVGERCDAQWKAIAAITPSVSMMFSAIQKVEL